MVVVRKKTRVVTVKKKSGTTSTPSPRVLRKAFKNGTQGELLRKKQDNERRQKLAHLISENIGKAKPLSMYEMMLKAGYSESYAKGHAQIAFAAAREEPEVQDYLARLKRIREKLLKRIEDQAERATIGQAAFPLQVVEKSIALAEGKPTDRIEHTLSEEEAEELDDILKDNE